MSPTPPLRVGVIGVGHLGRHHARLYAALPQAELVGIVDVDPERAATIAEQHGTRVFESAEALAGAVDAVSVAVPTGAHATVAIPLLEAGVHVLIEKPLAASLDEADAILEAARRNDRRVMVGHSERFNPAVSVFAREVSKPRFFEIHRLAAFTARSTDIDVVLDLMIHDLDLLLHLDGTEVTSVDAVGVAALTDKVDIANARLRFASGCVANLTASRISVESLRRIRVFEKNRYLSCDTGKRHVERHELDVASAAAAAAGQGLPQVRHDVLEVPDAEPLGEELAAFVDAILAGRRPPVDGDQARAALAVAYRVRESIASTSPAI